MFHVYRNAVCLGIGHQFFARQQVPFAPGRDHLDVRHQRIGAQLEAHLVVALAGGAVRDGLGAGCFGDLHQPLGDERAGNRGAEQVFAFIDGVAAEHRKDEIAHELLAQIVDEDVLLLDAELQRLGACRLEFLALAEIGGEGHHFAAVGILQPLQDDRSV